MRFYNQQHRFYCGVDLHATTRVRSLRGCPLAEPPTNWALPWDVSPTLLPGRLSGTEELLGRGGPGAAAVSGSGKGPGARP
jgi:hypothetical protein